MRLKRWLNLFIAKKIKTIIKNRAKQLDFLNHKRKKEYDFKIQKTV